MTAKTPWRVIRSEDPVLPADVVDADGNLVSFFDHLDMIVAAVNKYSRLPPGDLSEASTRRGTCNPWSVNDEQNRQGDHSSVEGVSDQA